MEASTTVMAGVAARRMDGERVNVLGNYHTFTERSFSARDTVSGQGLFSPQIHPYRWFFGPENHSCSTHFAATGTYPPERRRLSLPSGATRQHAQPLSRILNFCSDWG